MKRKVKKIYGKIFRIVSILFLLSCCIFYGYRLVKYYKIFNPKTTSSDPTLMSITIPKNSEIVYNGSGLYRLNGAYIYKGDVKDNYIMFSNMLFRIIKMTYGGTTEIVLDQPINTISYGKEHSTYDKSDINKYLNEYYINYLNKKYLEKTSICLDEINDISKINKKCKNTINTYVKLLDINTFLNVYTNSSYLADEDSYLWLDNISNTKVWNTSGYNISFSNADNYYDIKPVITLKYNTKIMNGKGTIDDPYIIEKENKNIHIGDYIKLDVDKWKVIDIKNNNLKLLRNEVLEETSSYSPSYDSYNPNKINTLAYYLNNEYLESLSYKDRIILSDFYTGKYTGSYETIFEDKVNCKIGLLSIADLKLDRIGTPYYLLNGDGSKIYTYSDTIILEKSSMSKYVRPVINIENKNILSGDGSLDNPYELEV